MSRELIWSESEGGPVDYADTPADAVRVRMALISAGEDPADLSSCTECPDHEEQPAVGCDECDTEMADPDDDE